MFLVVKPQLRKLVTRYEAAGRLTPDILAVVIVGFLVCAFITEEIGIHAIFGAFVFGVVMPREAAQALNHAILDKLEQVSVLLLLPVFFITTGLNVDVGGLDGQLAARARRRAARGLLGQVPRRGRRGARRSA